MTTLIPDPAQKLHSLFDDAWEFHMTENPLAATHCGDHRFNDKLPDVSESAEQRRAGRLRKFLDKLHAIPREELSEEDRVNYDIFEIELVNHIREFEFKTYCMGITKKGGYYKWFSHLPDFAPFKTIQDYDNYLSRLRAFAEWSAAHIELMRIGVKEGLVPPKILMDGIEESISTIIADEIEQSLFYAPCTKIPASFSSAESERLKNECRTIINECVNPTYRELLAYVSDEYISAARDSIATRDLPNGAEYYEFLINKFTSLDNTAEEIHQIGLREVALIRKEMDEVIKKADFTGSFKEFVEFLRTDPQFYVDKPEQLLKEAAYIAKRMDGELPKLFKTLPRTPYGVKPIPDHSAKYSVPGYYSLPSGDFTNAGFFWVNTYDLKSRSLYELEALTFHEAVPGHHLQFALQMELTDIPNFRRFGGDTAYCEGWALYSETLGKDAGFYTTPYTDFGRLTFRMWRACRLVVDPGMHYLGWSRQQAIDYMTENTALSLLNIENEVDRYINTPGQAVSYMMGELKMWELRKKVEQQQKDNFDLREFHDQILKHGGIPLKVLEKNIDEWVKETA